MKDPAFLFYSSDFLTGVSDLTMEERGQYITLLCLQHQKGHLSEKTIRLSVGSISVDVRNKFLLDDDNNLYNKILDEHIEERKNFIESRRNNGLKGGRPRNVEKPSAKPNGKPSANLPENENENENVIKDIDEKNKIKVDQIKNLCNGKDVEVLAAFDKWIDYMDKQHGVILEKNEYTYEILLDAIKRVGAENIIESINHSIACRYKRIFAKKDEEYKSSKNNQSTTNVNDKWAEKKRKLGIVG